MDLKTAIKHKKKHRHQHCHTQEHGTLQDQLPVCLTPPVNSFLEVDADTDAQLSSRDPSNMVSYSSIYLNSQQIAQEAEDMEKETSTNLENVSWEGKGGLESREQEHQEGTDRQDYGNGSINAQISEVNKTGCLVLRK